MAEPEYIWPIAGGLDCKIEGCREDVVYRIGTDPDDLFCRKHLPKHGQGGDVVSATNGSETGPTTSPPPTNTRDGWWPQYVGMGYSHDGGHFHQLHEHEGGTRSHQHPSPPPTSGGRWHEQPWPARALACPHRWLEVSGIKAEGWDKELYAVCLHDCGAIRQHVGGDEIMWPSSVVNALEAENAALKDVVDRITNWGDTQSEDWGLLLNKARALLGEGDTNDDSALPGVPGKDQE